MPSETILVSDFYKIDSDPENNLIRAEWLRGVSKEEMVAGASKLCEVLNETGITKVVAIAQRLVLLDSVTKEWMSTTFYTLLSQTPLQKLARVLPSNLFSKLALESVATRAEALGTNKFEYKNFANLEDALDWLNE